MSPRISGVRSATALGSLSAGSSTSLMPARFAPSTFSFTPPIGSTIPDRVISPVIASRSRTGRPLTRLTTAGPIAAPAAGPRQSIANRPPAEQADQRGDHRRTGRGSILRNRARRHVDVDVLLPEEV